MLVFGTFHPVRTYPKPAKNQFPASEIKKSVQKSFLNLTYSWLT